MLETPRLGRRAARRLLAAFGGPQEVLRAGSAAWVGMIDPSLGQALAHPSAELARLIRRTLDWLATSAEHHVLVLGDPAYPVTLLESPDPPLLLYAVGRAELLQRPAVAMVGSRHPTPQGRETAKAFARDLGRAGLTVISGLALGIDAAAHEGALDSLVATGSVSDAACAASTIAVVGTGLDQVYPRSHRALAARIAADGLVVSEFSLGTPPLAQNFPMRNRIIAGLAQGTLVVEAALQSGSLITARLASEAGREVFAIPGSIHATQSHGCHALIRQGATLVESVDDVLAELRLGPQLGSPQRPLSPAASAGAPLTGESRPRLADSADQAGPQLCVPTSDEADDDVLQALGWSAATLDVLQVRTGWSTSDLAVRLLTLELEGRVERLPGELFQRIAKA
ncbi:MAG: DNA-protecting protein DprA [Pseudomonadota bacterium]